MRVGTVCYATSQGLGHLAKSFYDAGVITDVMIFRHPHGEVRAPTHTNWYRPETIILTQRPFQGEQVERFLDDIDIMLFFETPFDWSFANRCHERGIKTAIMPMYEWFVEKPSHQFDLFLNPSLLDQEYFPSGVYIPVPVEDHIRWSLRKYAVNFLHNAGHIGSRNHKGTLEILQAMEFVEAPINLTIRCQDAAGMRRLMDLAPKAKTDNRITVVDAEIDRSALFSDEFDVYLAPEKYNGLSLPLQEAFASGMPVMTTQRFPHTEWLPEEIMIPVQRKRMAQTMNGHLRFVESLVSPLAIARQIDNLYGRNIEHLSQKGREYREASRWEMLKHRYVEALESVL